MSHLSENLAVLMDKQGLNATKLAQETGVPQPTIHRILKGVSKDPRTDTVKPLADYFGVSIDALRSPYLGAVDIRKHEPFGTACPDNGAWGAGTSLRDYFAAQAVSGILANGPELQAALHSGVSAADIPKKVALAAYLVADAMLAEREAS